MDTISQLIDDAVEKYYNDAAVRYENGNETKNVSYKTMKQDILIVAQNLQEKGLYKKHIAIIGGFCYEWLIVYYATLYSGNVAVPIDKDLSARDIMALVQQADSDAVFVDGDNKALLDYIRKDFSTPGNVLSFQSLKLPRGKGDTGGKSFKKVAIDTNQLAMIVFTSGTTGVSKGVMLTQSNLCNATMLCLELLGETDTRDNSFAALPPHHMFLVISGILMPTYLGEVICYCKSLKNAARTIKLIQPSALVLVPMVCESLYSRIMMEVRKSGKEKKLKMAIRLSNILRVFGIDIRKKLFKDIIATFGGRLEVIICGGAYLDMKLYTKFEEIGISLRNGYGITECSPTVSCNYPAYDRPGSVGYVGDKTYREVKIIDGEICVKGSIVMKGYYNDEKATAEAFYGEWFRTGDLGYIDSDGYLFITGRLKNLIILSDGNNISPEELENYLDPISLIKTSYVRTRNEHGIDVLTACVFPDFDYAKDNGITDIHADLQRHIDEINKGLPRYKKIQKIEIAEQDFETTPLGKVKRFLYV